MASPIGAAATEPEKSPTEQLEEAADKLMTFLRIALVAIPQYELPEVLPNGDIIIRRVHPPMEDPNDAPKSGEELPNADPDKPTGPGDKGVRT
jgi:hypothetical protein